METDSLESPRVVVKALYQDYLQSEHVTLDLNLEPLFRLKSDLIPYRRQRLSTFSAQLSENENCSFALEQVLERVTTEDTLAPAEFGYYESALAFAGVLVDITNKYPDIRRRYVTRRLNDALRSSYDKDSVLDILLDAGTAVYELATRVTTGHRTLAMIRELQTREDITFAHPDDSYRRFRVMIQTRIESGKTDDIRSVQQNITESLEATWERQDLLQFRPIEFENLLAELWDEYHDATWVTRARQDRGIDVVVRSAEGDRILIQAKRYAQHNTVGIDEVQRTAGLLLEFPASEAVLITSSSFTKSAKKSAKSIDNLRLVDGETLCYWLTESSLCPPTDVLLLNRPCLIA